MPLHVRTATSFRWRPTVVDGQCEDIVRVNQHDDVQLALLANGYECGFSTCWPPASRLILDLFEEAWATSRGGVEERLSVAFARARERFNAQVPALVPQDADFPDDLPRAVLLAVATLEDTAHAAWIGGDIAVLARGFVAAAETTPHTLREQYKRDHPDGSVDLDQIPNVLVRTIGPRATSQDAPAAATFHLEPSDTLILLSKANFRGPCVPANDAAFAAAAYSSPTILAERLADLAFANEDAPYAATAVLRFDAVDVRSEIERLIDCYEPDPRHGDWLLAWSRSNRALPVFFDMGGALALRADGVVISVPWDAPESSPQEENSPAVHLAAVVGASRMYPSLKALVPRRPEPPRTCPHCGTTSAGAGPGCPLCWYLGWMPPEPPGWFHRPSPAPRSEQGRGRPDGSTPWWRRIFGGGS